LYPSNAWTFLSTQQFSQLYEVWATVSAVFAS
jgi:hypothetical protein